MLKDAPLAERIDGLDREAKKRVMSFARTLGRADDVDEERVLKLAGGLVAAFEYQHFHDLVNEIEDARRDPDMLAELLERILRWKTLESRAILEIVSGRLEIVDEFQGMIIEDLPETAPQIGLDNLHDLLSSFPWLIHPDWQTFEHEATIQNILNDWKTELADEDRKRVDFLSLADNQTLVVVEVKRPGIAASLDEYQRLQGYIEKLRRAWTENHGGSEVRGLLVATELNFGRDSLSPNVEWARWADLHQRVRRVYEHYRAVLTQDVASRQFHDREVEVAATRKVLEQGSYRAKPAALPTPHVTHRPDLDPRPPDAAQDES